MQSNHPLRQGFVKFYIEPILTKTNVAFRLLFLIPIFPEQRSAATTWYYNSAFIQKIYVLIVFCSHSCAGRLTVEEQKLEGEFRYVNSRLVTNSEEVIDVKSDLKIIFK